MDTQPALDPLAVPEHVHTPDATGPACLTMGLAALDLVQPGRSLLHGPGATSPGGVALEALRHGAHAILQGPARDEDQLGRARAAGLMHRRRAPSAKDVLAALEARRVCLARLDRGPLSEGGQGPGWVLAVSLQDEAVALHDPRLEEGPTASPWEDLSAALGALEHACLLTLAPASREHE